MDHEFKAFKKSKKYKDIIKKGVKVVFKHVQTSVVDGGGGCVEGECSSNDNEVLSFDEILLNEIKKSDLGDELVLLLKELKFGTNL